MVLVACAESKLTQPNRSIPIAYRVYKIDSINNYYLIYVKKSDSIYKIVSQKDAINNCRTIKKNGYYAFKIHSSLSSFKIGNLLVTPKGSDIVNCFAYDKSTNICFEGDSIRDLYYADNIKGLCFVR